MKVKASWFYGLFPWPVSGPQPYLTFQLIRALLSPRRSWLRSQFLVSRQDTCHRHMQPSWPYSGAYLEFADAFSNPTRLFGSKDVGRMAH